MQREILKEVGEKFQKENMEVASGNDKGGYSIQGIEIQPKHDALM